MPKAAVTYSPEVGGASVISLKNSFSSVNCEVVDADYREMMRGIPKEEFDEAYKTSEGRSRIFAHAKFIAEKFLDNVDCLALSGNIAMIDPELFNQVRMEGQSYDFSRTIAELALVHVATQRGMPIMGICGGHQVVAVYGGGTIKDLNAAELDKQRFLNYDAIRFNADSMLKKIVGQNLNSDNPLEQEFFGAHNQAVDELGKGFLKTAIGSDGKLIEAAESEHGAPVITTQFHPEVAVHGLPNSPFLYKKIGLEREISLKIFDFFAKAGETYRNKKNLANEIKYKIKKIDNPFVKGKEKEKKINSQDLLKQKSINSFHGDLNKLCSKNDVIVNEKKENDFAKNINEGILVVQGVYEKIIDKQKNIINKYPDNAPKAIAYLSGFIDCARKAQVISEKEYQAFKAQVLELMP